MIDMNKVPGYKAGGPTVGLPQVPGSRPLGTTQAAGQRQGSTTRQEPYAPQPQAQAAAQPQAAPQASQQSIPSGTQGGPGYDMGFQTPQQLNQAGQIYTQLGQGQFYIPRQIQQGSQAANQMLQGGGNPGSTAAYQQAAMPVLQKQMEDIRKQAMASANVSGMGNSSVLGAQIGQQQGDLMNQFNMNLANQQMGLDESAKSRMLQAMGMLGNFGGQELQADQFGQNMALQSAQGLQGLGGQYWNMPFQVANQMAGLGGQYNQSMLTPLDQQYAQMLGLGAQASGQQQYTPGFMTNLASGLGAAAQYAPGIMQGLGIGQGQGSAQNAGQWTNAQNVYRSQSPYLTGFSLSPYTSQSPYQLNLNPYAGQAIQPYNLAIR